MSTNIFNTKGCFTRLQWWQINLFLVYLFIEWKIVSFSLFDKIYPPKEVILDNGWTQGTPTAFFDNITDLFDVFSIGSFSLMLIVTLFFLFALTILWVSITSAIKRLHDINKPTKWWFITLIPVIGPLYIFILNGFFASKNNPYCNNREKNELWFFSIFALLLNTSFLRTSIVMHDWPWMLYLLLDISLYEYLNILLVSLLFSFGLFLDQYKKEKIITILSATLILLFDYLRSLWITFSNDNFIEESFHLIPLITLATYLAIVFFSIRTLRQKAI